MDTIKKSFGSRIKEIREKQGLSQEKLAELINMESRHLSRIETGRSFTTLENIEKIAKTLNVEIEDLFCFRHKQNKNILINEINIYLQNADKDKLELSYKLIKALFN